VRTFLIRAVVIACGGAIGLGTTVAGQTTSPAAVSREWTLDDVLKAALSQHPLVEAANARLAAAEGARRTAGAWPNPVATYWVENVSSGLTRESSVYGTLPLEPLFQRGSRLAQAGSGVRAEEASVTSAERQVATDVVHAFHRLALAQVTAEAMLENLAAIEQVVTYLRNRVAQGAAPESDLIRAEVERDRAQTELTMADIERIRAQSSLRTYLGDAAQVGNVRVAMPVWSREHTSLAPLTEFTAYALAHRSDLIAARARADAAAGALALERSMVVRQFGASFGVKRMSGVTGFVGGISLAIPVFDQNGGAIDRAAGERLAAELETRWMERAIASEVEAQYQVAERLGAQATSLQSSFLARAEESRKIAIGTYQEGAASLLQVLDASRALSEARLTSARVIVAANESLFDLGIAAGYDPRTSAVLGRGPAAETPTHFTGGSR
jgi:cobalt-zinc-cadmium efflux system outer membrane protein